MDADTKRDDLLGESLREHALALLIGTCGAWSRAVTPQTGEIDQKWCDYASAQEGKLRAAINELADLSKTAANG